MKKLRVVYHVDEKFINFYLLSESRWRDALDTSLANYVKVWEFNGMYAIQDISKHQKEVLNVVKTFDEVLEFVLKNAVKRYESFEVYPQVSELGFQRDFYNSYLTAISTGLNERITIENVLDFKDDFEKIIRNIDYKLEMLKSEFVEPLQRNYLQRARRDSAKEAALEKLLSLNTYAGIAYAVVNELITLGTFFTKNEEFVQFVQDYFDEGILRRVRNKRAEYYTVNLYKNQL